MTTPSGNPTVPVRTKLSNPLTILFATLSALRYATYKYTVIELFFYFANNSFAIWRFSLHWFYGLARVPFPPPFDKLLPFEMGAWPLGSIDYWTWFAMMIVAFGLHMYALYNLNKHKGMLADSMYRDSTNYALFWASWAFMIVMSYANITEFMI